MLTPHYTVTPKSGNKKTGPIPVSMSHRGTCPPSCPLRDGCYSAYGHMSWTWNKLDRGDIGTPWGDFLANVKALPENTKIWRHNESGDLPGFKNRLNKTRCMGLVEANRDGGANRGGFTYTHYSPLPTAGVTPTVAKHNAEVIAAMNTNGFTVNLSGDNLHHADQLAELDIGPVVAIVPSDVTKATTTPAGRKVIVCPAVTRGLTCEQCKACARGKRNVIIAFPAHGPQKRKVDAMVREDGCDA